MSPYLVLAVISFYFALLLIISWYTGRNAGNAGYFLGNKASPWYAVAFGMIGDSLSGVTFISVPGWVGSTQFSYMQMVLGYLVGYYVITAVLLPLYYRLNLTSIYSYLGERFGVYSHRTGSFFFLLSRTIGAAFRLYMAAKVMQIFLFDGFGVPFWLNLVIIILLILIYTYRGGIKTLVWTDTLQSGFLLLGVILSIAAIFSQMSHSFGEIAGTIADSEYSRVFFFDNWKDKTFFFKQFFGGMFVAIAMTGLDQNMMQKNLSCRTLPEAQKNIRWFSVVLVFVNVFFLSLGALLYIYSHERGIALPAKTDDLFPMLALNHLGKFAGIVFIVGLTAATFSSADSVLTTLTTSFCIDFLKFDRTDHPYSEQKKTSVRHWVHFMFAAVLLIVILVFSAVNKDAVIAAVFSAANYTYGPLLGLFAFGLFVKHKINDRLAPVVCIAAPLACYFLDSGSKTLLQGYVFGNELLILNGALTFAGLFLVRRKTETFAG